MEQRLKKLISEALKLQATDIHFMFEETEVMIKLRINDYLIKYATISLEDYQRLVLLIKYKSQMNLSKVKGPQSSAFDLRVADQVVRIRVSAIMTNKLESLVLRLNNGYQKLGLTELILNETKITELLTNKVKNGLILITGPTGSGKTTLSYCLLHKLKQLGLSIVSIEDPVETYEKGFVQLQINEEAGVSYEVSVKEVLRHDPDVIFIGEIRDSGSAKAAIRSALTGHLVISTIHAISALKAIFRLLELGISKLELEQVLTYVSNQRLAFNNTKKRIILEELTKIDLEKVFLKLNIGENYHYQTITEIAKLYPEYQVIK